MTWADPEPALARPPRRRLLAPIVVPQVLTVALAVGALGPAAVEVNGRPGVQQVLAHAGAEWTVLLRLE